ncbi:hypothetical protein SFRURICE_016921 [Spodoptera frugiperda]|nr:hypothetical protein SFRURICE_016921 [Spodoptera frugiperda]
MHMTPRPETIICGSAITRIASCGISIHAAHYTLARSVCKANIIDLCFIVGALTLTIGEIAIKPRITKT